METVIDKKELCMHPNAVCGSVLWLPSLPRLCAQMLPLAVHTRNRTMNLIKQIGSTQGRKLVALLNCICRTITSDSIGSA